LQSILDNAEQEPIFQWFDKQKVAEELRTGFECMRSFFMNPEMTTCINLYSLNFWFKRNKVIVTNGVKEE
jgi:hypothetical protein